MENISYMLTSMNSFFSKVINELNHRPELGNSVATMTFTGTMLVMKKM